MNENSNFDKKNPFAVPDGYFEDFAAKMASMTQISMRPPYIKACSPFLSLNRRSPLRYSKAQMERNTSCWRTSAPQLYPTKNKRR